ncbi:MAG TPA: prepilin-type N-terminal cleavage/methylation domain-containing protein [Candidatus Eisenbacteria bacterium]|nr:prepilin-type N-terminal cleavage/methylation domain-containing protein [Candidatus Eisenbacteria bacterium]
MRRNQKGFTLMELMVVIVIVAILAAVAVPLYINYVKDAQRTEAKGAIGAIITAEQTYYQLNREYANCPAFVVNPTPEAQNGLNCDLSEALNNWDFAVTGASDDGFVVTATGKNAAEDLSVTYTHSRANPPAQPWVDQ